MLYGNVRKGAWRADLVRWDAMRSETRPAANHLPPCRARAPYRHLRDATYDSSPSVIGRMFWASFVVVHTNQSRHWSQPDRQQGATHTDKMESCPPT